MDTTFYSIHPYYIALTGSMVAILGVYLFFWRTSSRKETGPKTAQKEVPLNLSPAAVRFLWKGEVDWDMLLTIAFSAVQKQVYRFGWNRAQGSAYFQLLDESTFGRLAHEERAALTMGRNAPLKNFMFARKKKRLDETMAHRAESYLKKKFKHFINPVQRWVLIGLGLNVVLLLILGRIFLQLAPGQLLLDGMLMGFMIVGTILYLDRFLDESSNVQKWGYAFMGILLLGVFISIDLNSGFPVIAALGFAIPVHIWMYFHLPKLSAEGQRIQQQILQYKEYLWKEKLVLEVEDIPYCLALDIPCDETEQINHLLTEGWESSNNFLPGVLSGMISSIDIDIS
ncbi:MAG: hypothetical protein AAF587_31715 [Bacteroidota bacterium]